MTSKQFELIQILTSFYGGNRLKAIGHCINAIDTPLNMWCCKLKAQHANNAYLDIMNRTMRNFKTAPIIDSFCPDDIHNGQAANWIGFTSHVLEHGGGGAGLASVGW